MERGALFRPPHPLILSRPTHTPAAPRARNMGLQGRPSGGPPRPWDACALDPTSREFIDPRVRGGEGGGGRGGAGPGGERKGVGRSAAPCSGEAGTLAGRLPGFWCWPEILDPMSGQEGHPTASLEFPGGRTSLRMERHTVPEG